MSFTSSKNDNSSETTQNYNIVDDTFTALFTPNFSDLVLSEDNGGAEISMTKKIQNLKEIK